MVVKDAGSDQLLDLLANFCGPLIAGKRVLQSTLGDPSNKPRLSLLAQDLKPPHISRDGGLSL